MGLSKDKPGRLIRGAKTLFFLLTMSLSLLLFSLPILLLAADAILPAALFSAASLSPAQSLAAHLRNYDFRVSLVDIPFISIARSLAILFVYYLCDGPGLSRAPYLAVTTLCSLVSMVVVSLKACVFRARQAAGGGGRGWFVVGESWAVEVLFVSSLVLAVAHVVAAYRTSCRERRKLLVYKIDIEAVLACKKGIPSYHKIIQVRTK